MRRFLSWVLGPALCVALASCAGPMTVKQAAAWQQQLALFSQDLADLEAVAESAQTKKVVLIVREATLKAESALALYQAAGGDELSTVELLVALDAALVELDTVLLSEHTNGDLRDLVLAVRIALRHMAAGVRTTTAALEGRPLPKEIRC